MNHAEAGRLGYEKIKDKFISQWKKQKKEAQDKYFSNPKYCPNCNQQIPYEKRVNKFCNHSCRATYSNLGVCRNGKPKKNKNCLNCEKKLPHGNKKFCNKKCQFIYQWNLIKIDIEKGLITRPDLQKKYLKEKYGEKCSICNIDEWMGKIAPLVLDHIDGNAENNFPNNLRLVCGNCNMQLDTFAGRNIGNGRKERRERYLTNEKKAKLHS